MDEFDMYSAFERLIAQLGESKINFDKPGSRKRLADEVNCGSYRDFFIEDAASYDISAFDTQTSYLILSQARY